MSKSKKALVVINFGGPRSLEEVPDFLEALLTDEEVIRTPLPLWLQTFFFKRIARKRAEKVAEDYALIGGKSPIFEDTEWVCRKLEEKLQIPTLAFHRYLRQTHEPFIETLSHLEAEELFVFPFFPQFSYATSGSVAKWFSSFISPNIYQKMQWIFSYAEHPLYIALWVEKIQEFLKKSFLNEEETALVFSAHGLPKSFIEGGDPYQKECEECFTLISSQFPKALSILSYQSEFGKSEWIKPSTKDLCQSVENWISGKKNIVFIPLSFTSDHIETLFEVEEQYMKPLKDRGYHAYRCPAFGRDSKWIDLICSLIEEMPKKRNDELLRSSLKRLLKTAGRRT